MNIYELMDSKRKSYTNTDNYIYQMCRKNPDVFANEPINSLVGIYNLSQPSLTRFAKKLGFNGFNEFQYQLSQDLQGMGEDKEESASVAYGKVLRSVEEAIDPAELEALAGKLISSDFVYMAGSSFSEIPAQYLHMAFNITRFKHSEIVDFNHTFFAPRQNDTVITFSVAGGISALTSDYSFVDNAGYSILVTMNPKHPLRKHFTKIVLLPDVKAAYGNQLVSSETMAFLMFCDMLIDKITKLQK